MRPHCHGIGLGPGLGLGLGLLIGGCAYDPPRSAQELANEDACRTMANRVYDAQHRDLLTREDQSLTPFSSSGSIATPDQGLSDLYAHETRVNDCIARKTSATRNGMTFGPQGSN